MPEYIRKPRHEVLLGDQDGLDHSHPFFVIPEKEIKMTELAVQVGMRDFVITMIVNQVRQPSGPCIPVFWRNAFGYLDATKSGGERKNAPGIEIVPNDLACLLSFSKGLDVTKEMICG